MFILMINLFLFFFLPLVVLFLTKKRPIHQMILWTTIVQAIALFARIILYPIAWTLSWGIPFSDAISRSNFSNWYSGSGMQLLYLTGISIVFTALAILCTALYRRKKEPQ